jgi:aminopeptidase N
MKHRLFFFLFAVMLFVTAARAQRSGETLVFTRADTLRGMLTPVRTCYDVTYYHLDVRIDTLKKALSGSNTIQFRVVDDFDRMQVDLFSNLNVDGITIDGSPATYERESNAVFVTLPKKVKKGTIHQLKFSYSGTPQIATNPPWQGGLTWRYDVEGNPWVCVTCQGTGASIWWPNKDHQSDEPDSMMISITVPPGLEDVSNGKLRAVTTLPDGWKKFDWFVGNPINNYNVTINIGKFAHFSDTYKGEEHKYSLDYYVMPENLEKAKVQFQQVKPMLKCFEQFFGPYPFWEDGYKLIESPHNGMEHQSAVAYGNGYVQGYRGRASSAVGMKFDFIIIHETAHEWWGNSLTSSDIADMWLHESFGAYAEAVYVECLYGREESLKYINGKESNVRNDRPIIGIYNVQYQGSGDMYDKGQLVLNTLRSVIDNDKLWFEIVRGFAVKHIRSSVQGDDFFSLVKEKTGKDLSYFFDQYLKHAKIPVLQVNVVKKGNDVSAMYRWDAEVQNFEMPVKVTTSPGKFEFIYPTTSWNTTKLNLNDPSEFQVAENLFLIDTQIRRSYLDPSLPDSPARRRN